MGSRSRSRSRRRWCAGCYASLLVSDNLAIRGFGLASLIGEVTCVIAAFVIVPAIVALPRLRPQLLPYGECAASSGSWR